MADHLIYAYSKTVKDQITDGTAVALSRHSTGTAPSLSRHCSVTVPSLLRHFCGTLPSLYRHSPVIIMSIYYYSFPVTYFDGCTKISAVLNEILKHTSIYFVMKMSDSVIVPWPLVKCPGR